MDEFLSDIHTAVFRQWILGNKSLVYRIYVSPKDSDVVVIETDYCYSEITFNPLNIIELSVTNSTNGNVEFYLHFQMKTLKHALELFEEMLESIRRLVTRPVIKVLLSCSGGLTTSYFAQRLNEAAKFLLMDYEFGAVGYNELYNIGSQYDVIMLAPQISYLHAKVQEIFDDKLILKIPSLVFAKYDVGKAISLIKEEVAQFKQKKDAPNQPLSLKVPIHQNTKILCIAMIRSSRRVQLAYRIYDEHNQIILDADILKNKISLEDIYDILDFVLVKHADIKLVGISMPGIINDGKLSLPQEGFDDCDIVGLLSQRYSQKFVLDNDVNCVAVGYYVSQDKYTTLSFLFQPKAGFAGGVGNIFHGQLIEGRHHIAGEIKYLPMQLSDDAQVLTKTPEGALELVAKTMVSIISVLGPDLIVFSCQLISQLDELVKEMSKYMPRQYLPELVKVDNLKEYTLLGQMILCVEAIDG